MPWWGWLALGAALLAAEVAVQTEFWLALIGAAALTLGLLTWLTGISGPVWAEWLVFSLLAVGFIVFFRKQVHAKLVGHPVGLEPELEGEVGVALEAIAPGALGQVSLRGSNWRARNVGNTPVADRGSVRVTGRSGIMLEIEGGS